jgi:hypothetical protein
VTVGADAAVSGCTACQVQCPGFLWPRNNHCYELASATANALEPGTSAANGLCTAQFNAHVVTFASDDEFRAVAAHYADAGAFWVGVFEPSNTARWQSINPYEPGWSPVCPGCFAHLDADASAIPLADPKSTTSFCVQATPGADPPTWQGVPCMNLNPKIHVICEHEPSGLLSHNCPDGVCIELPATFGSKRYVLNPLASTADDAARACAALGGRLVVLQSRDERDQLWNELQRTASKPQSIWIGLTLRSAASSDAGDAGDTGDAVDAAHARPTGWVWDDDTPVDGYPPPWAGNEPRSGTDITPRAYMNHQPFFSDDTLAHSTPPTMLPSSVCELPVGDGGR